MTLAQRGAAEFGKTESGHSIKVCNAGLDIGRQFYVSIIGPSYADLLIEVESSSERGKFFAYRSFEDRPSESLPSQPLDPLALESDSRGNPTASIRGQLLDESGIIDEMIKPLKIAVAITPDDEG
jgi:hypothetical protein